MTIEYKHQHRKAYKNITYNNKCATSEIVHKTSTGMQYNKPVEKEKQSVETWLITTQQQPQINNILPTSQS